MEKNTRASLVQVRPQYFSVNINVEAILEPLCDVSVQYTVLGFGVLMDGDFFFSFGCWLSGLWK